MDQTTCRDEAIISENEWKVSRTKIIFPDATKFSNGSSQVGMKGKACTTIISRKELVSTSVIRRTNKVFLSLIAFSFVCMIMGREVIDEVKNHDTL